MRRFFGYLEDGVSGSMLWFLVKVVGKGIFFF